ncbi:hypothetical protein CAL20_15295 [Bordetella genomosp. 4]|uniref:Uncharacterized protein n=1 Tax=Bordetella genomosp. 4 TaxID=463044 RepID=A0A261U7D7_9BORD|nr:hypothetical protein CAL20_15295 [Bordetella genomosp. 4]
MSGDDLLIQDARIKLNLFSRRLAARGSESDWLTPFSGPPEAISKLWRVPIRPPFMGGFAFQRQE